MLNPICTIYHNDFGPLKINDNILNFQIYQTKNGKNHAIPYMEENDENIALCHTNGSRKKRYRLTILLIHWLLLLFFQYIPNLFPPSLFRSKKEKKRDYLHGTITFLDYLL